VALILGRSNIFCSSPKHPDRFWGKTSFLLGGYQWPVFLGVYWQVREADHSPQPTSPKFKLNPAVPLVPHMTSSARKDNSTFLLAFWIRTLIFKKQLSDAFPEKFY
jgi:hypothetical protein